MTAQQQVLNDFIDKLQVCVAFDEMSRHFHEAYKRLGFTLSAYVRFHPYHFERLPATTFSRTMVMTTSYPAQWRCRYNERSYHRVDPVIHRCRGSMAPVVWTETIRCTQLDRVQKNLFMDAHDFGLHDGVAIPIHGPREEFALVGLASEAPAKEFRRLVAARRHAAHLMALHFHEAVYRVLDGEERPQEDVGLTRRERECLRWTARGKSSWDISRILGVSERTVNFHMGNAIEKLDVTNRTHAVAKSIAQGLIEV